MSRYLASFATALLLFAMTLPVAQAQMGMSPAKIGIRGGLTQATLYGDDIAKSDFRPGFTGGLFFTYRANKAFSIQPEVLYSVRGGKNVDLDATAAEESIRARHDFLEIPVLLKLTAPLNKIKPRLFVGPAIGFLLNSELDGADADDSFKSVDFGAVIGGELAINVGRGTGGVLDEIALDGRYNLGLVNLGDTEALDAVRTSALTGTLSLRFNL
jgi:hypothetical protein